MEKVYKSLKELHDHLLPALRCKKHEIEMKKGIVISENFIWDYLTTSKWKQANNLSLAKMVDDILNTENDLFIKSYKEHKN